MIFYQYVKTGAKGSQGYRAYSRTSQLGHHLPDGNTHGLSHELCPPDRNMDEMSSLTPSMAGVNYPTFGKRKLTVALFQQLNTRELLSCIVASSHGGLGLFSLPSIYHPEKCRIKDYPFLLSTGRILYHYNVTTPYSPHSQCMDKELAEFHLLDRRKDGLNEDSQVKINSRRG